jgi:DNA helicase II / ATP-dependent DNA helicase PcrA
MDLNAEQKRIAFQDPKGHALLKGVAGSGKTSVGICRIPFLLQNYCFAKDDAILVATYNRTLVGYMTHLYEKMDCKEFAAFTSLFAATEDKLEIRTVDSLMYPYYRLYTQEKGIACNVWATNSTLYEVLSDGISKTKKDFPGVSVLKQKHTGFLLDEITWIKDCLYLEEEEYQTADRVGKVKAQQANQPQRLLKNSDTRKAIFNLRLYFDDQLRKRGLATFSDMRIWALEQARKKPGQRYTHIIVDESQDLTRAQLLFLKLIYNPKDYASFLFIADTAQSIYPQSWLGSGRSFTSIGFNMTGKSQSLSKNFRTTTQISQAAYCLIENCSDIVEDENFVKPTLIEKQGDYPVYRSFENEKAQSEFLCREIKALIDTVPARDCAVIARFKNQLNQIKAALENGDAELVYAFEARGGKGEVLAHGGLDQGSVTKAVLDVMEGTEEAFRRRREKYHF